jgi:hypothetical protein
MRPLSCAHAEHHSTHAPEWLNTPPPPPPPPNKFWTKIGGSAVVTCTAATTRAVVAARARAGSKSWLGFGMWNLAPESEQKIILLLLKKDQINHDTQNLEV